MKKFILLTMMSIAARMAVGQDLHVCYGKGYTLTSTATATAGATYKWYEKVNDGAFAEIPSETGASLHLNAKENAGTYQYVRKASNAACTEVASNTFTVRVNALPTVTASAAASACAGATVVFTAAAGGGTTAAMTYTWTIAGATASTTTATYRRTLSTTGSNTYSVTVRNSNGCVSAASSAKTITINGPAGRDQAATCGCTSGLTACNGYCRNLADDGAVCYSNREVRQICVDNDYAQNCPGGAFGLAQFSIANTQALLALIWDTYGVGHHIWTAEIDSANNCRYACKANEGCSCIKSLTVSLGWFGAR
jgi:hypothetical protein